MARAPSRSSTTAEMMRSLAPWAMATTLQPTSARASKNVPATPARVRMPSPTMLSTARPRRRSTGSRKPAASSLGKASWMAATAPGPSDRRTAKQMESSDELWVMSTAEMPFRARALKTRPAMPGVPGMPGPVRFTTERSPRKDSPRTPLGGGGTSSRMRVPGWAGSKLLHTRTGMPRSRTGGMVLGCRTLAPKKESSMASSKLASGSGKASGTRPGSAL